MSLNLFSKAIDAKKGAISNKELEDLIEKSFRWYGQSSFSAFLPAAKTGEDTSGMAGPSAYGAKVVYFDPFNLPEGAPKADLILISHDHIDHANESDISKILTGSTVIAADNSFGNAHSQLVKNADYRQISAGKRVEVNGFYVEAIPAYNLKAAEHPKGSGLGVILSNGFISIYHAGDSDLVPEIKSLAGKIDVALLPVGGEVTMDVKSAAEAVKVIQPRIAIPMHYDGHFEYSDGFKFDLGGPEDGNQFKRNVQGLNLLCKVFVLANQGKTNYFRI